jgi:hypothetical protein
MLSSEAERVTQVIMQDYQNQQGPFEDVESSILPVESVMDEMFDEDSDTREMALYLTLSTSLNFMRQADRLRQRTMALWTDENWIYRPSVLVEEDRYEDLLNLFKGQDAHANHPVFEEHGLMEYGKQDADIWFTIAATLYEEHDSNPIHLFESFEDDAQAIFDHVQTDRREEPAHERIRFTKKYPYLGGEKVGPLWLRLTDDLVYRLDGVQLLPLPVDRQIVKVTNVLDGTEYPLEPDDDDRQEIRELWHPFCKEYGYSTAELDDALWRIGEEENWDAWGEEYIEKIRSGAS